MFYVSMMFVCWEDWLSDEPIERVTHMQSQLKDCLNTPKFGLSSLGKINHNIQANMVQYLYRQLEKLTECKWMEAQGECASA